MRYINIERKKEKERNRQRLRGRSTIKGTRNKKGDSKEEFKGKKLQRMKWRKIFDLLRPAAGMRVQQSSGIKQKNNSFKLQK